MRWRKAEAISWSLEKFDVVDSTQKVAHKLANQGADEGLVVIASTQTAGRGRNGRQWLSPRGSLYMSLILRPKKRNGEVQLLPLVGAFAVADGIMKDSGIVPFVRWPNDVLLNGKKVAGVIAESVYRGNNLSYVILGMGINCNIRVEDSLGEYSQLSTSLMEELGGVKVDLSILRDKVLDCFAPLYLEWERSGGRIVGRRKAWISTIGKKVEIIRGNEKAVYLAEDVKEDGSLVVSSSSKSGSTVIRVEDMDRLREL